MEEMQLIGVGVSIVITLGSFIAVITKFTQPINDLRIVIQKLNDSIDNMKKDHEKHDRRITKHGEELDELKVRVKDVETKMQFYHHD